MAFAIEIAAALSWLPRVVAATVLLGLLAAGTPAVGAEQVFVWRDQNGTIQFSPVREPQRDATVVSESQAARSDAEPRLVASEKK